jgi:hypothetical protein
MASMAKDVPPQEETTGKLTATYLVYVSVEEEERIPEAAKELEAPLRRAVAESYPGQAGCAVVQGVSSMTPPPESGHTGWPVRVTALIDLTVWRRDVGPANGGYAAMTLRDLLADADLTACTARLDKVETLLLVHAPA